MGYSASGKKSIVISAGARSYIGEATVVWQDDLDELAARRKVDFTSAHGATPTPPAKEKMLSKVNPQDIPGMLHRDVDVLLYDLTAEYDTWDMRCEG